MTETSELFKLQGELGYNRNFPRGCSVDNIKVRQNTKLSDKYVVGGSTFVSSYIHVNKRTDKLFIARFNEYFSTADSDPHFVVFGHLHSRSPLLRWTLQCRFCGFLPSKSQKDRHPELSNGETDLCELFSCDRSNKYSLVPFDSSAFVFEIMHICGPPEKLSWCEPMIKSGKNHGRYEGENLRKLGLISYKGKKNGYNLLEMQTTRFRLAAFGMKDSFGNDKLSMLNNTSLKNVLGFIRVKGGKKFKQSFPGYSFYGNRILESARYFAHDDLYCKLLSNFLPSSGQYLRDNYDTLCRLSEKFVEEEDDIDSIFYGDFDICFDKVARQEQVRDTLVHWMEYRPDFRDCLDGWEKRYNDWVYYFDMKSKYGATAFKMDESRDVCSMKSKVGIDGVEYCFFQHDWDLCKKFISFVNADSFICDLDGCADDVFLFPTKALLRYSKDMKDSVHIKKSLVFGLPYNVYVDTMDRCDYQKYLDEVLNLMSAKSRVILYGMEYWKLDHVCYLFWNLDASRVKMHYFGGNVDTISCTSKAYYGLTPLYDELCNYVDDDICCTSSVPTHSLERENEFDNVSDLQSAMRAALSCVPKLQVSSYEHGYQIVYFQNSDKADAFSLIDRKGLLGVSEFDENNLYVGDRVITRCGFIDTIKRIHAHGRTVTHVNRELYTGCFVTLAMDDKQYHPTELNLGYAVKHTNMLCPCANVVLVGTLPDYVKEQYETFLCTSELLYYKYKSQNDELSFVLDKEVPLSSTRLNPLKFVIHENESKKQMKELFDEDEDDF